MPTNDPVPRPLSKRDGDGVVVHPVPNERDAVMKQNRIPATSSSMPVWRREIACGHDPGAALAAAMKEAPIGAGQVWKLAAHHDGGCPSLEAAGMPACTCELVRLEARRIR